MPSRRGADDMAPEAPNKKREDAKSRAPHGFQSNKSTNRLSLAPGSVPPSKTKD